ncbi:hypothetical protein [Asticcacaulis sp.]|uniref:hypothetical protein n=1 Tax=Asticcacaulis sp. TaxID=1872648 RepID=UPI003F7BE38B
MDDQTAQQHLPPEERRGLLRAFADRMLLKITAMDDPEDLPGVERAVRVAAVIERLYNRCDRAERQRDHTPDPRKAEAERATHEEAAIKARVSLAGTLKWGEERRRDLGQWWDAAQDIGQNIAQTAPASHAPLAHKAAPAGGPKVTYVDYTEAFEAARAEMALKKAAQSPIKPAQKPPPPI